jgi:hypothetical protein
MLLSRQIGCGVQQMHACTVTGYTLPIRKANMLAQVAIHEPCKNGGWQKKIEMQAVRSVGGR